MKMGRTSLSGSVIERTRLVPKGCTHTRKVSSHGPHGSTYLEWYPVVLSCRPGGKSCWSRKKQKTSVNLTPAHTQGLPKINRYDIAMPGTRVPRSVPAVYRKFSQPDPFHSPTDHVGSLQKGNPRVRCAMGVECECSPSASTSMPPYRPFDAQRESEKCQAGSPRSTSLQPALRLAMSVPPLEPSRSSLTEASCPETLAWMVATCLLVLRAK